MLEAAEKVNSSISHDLAKLLDEFIQDLRKLEKDGKIDLSDRIDIRNNRELERAVKDLEREIQRRLLDEFWVWTQILNDHLIYVYRTTTNSTLDFFIPMKKYSELAINYPKVLITDTYITEQKIKIPWCKDGKIYSQRLYENVANFSSKLAFVLEEGITKGKGIEWMIRSWRKLTGSSAYDAARLIKTETAAFWGRATKDTYLNLGIEYVMIVNDSACGEVCLDYVDGEPIPLREAEIGDLLPPYHPNCACSFVAYTEETDDIAEDISD